MKKKFPIAALLVIAAILSSQLFVSLSLFEYNSFYGIIGMTSAAVLAVVLLILYAIFSKNSIRHITKMNTHLENSAAEYMNTLPAPIAVIGAEGKLLWYNSAFTDKICGGCDVYGMSFEECVKLNIKVLTENGSAVCHVNDSIYKVVYEEFSENDITFLIFRTKQNIST